MNFLPSEKVTFQSSLKVNEINERLLAVTEPEKLLRLNLFNNEPHRLYEGQVDQRSFSLRRIINYRNSFLPSVKGTYVSSGSGTQIDIRMRLHIAILIFLGFWCLIVGTGFVIFLMISISEHKFSPFIAVPLFMLLIVYGVTVGAFNYEASKAKKDFSQLFEVDPS